MGEVPAVVFPLDHIKVRSAPYTPTSQHTLHPNLTAPQQQHLTALQRQHPTAPNPAAATFTGIDRFIWQPAPLWTCCTNQLLHLLEPGRV